MLKPGRSEANWAGWSPHSRSVQAASSVVLEQHGMGCPGKALETREHVLTACKPQSKSETQMGFQMPPSIAAEPRSVSPASSSGRRNLGRFQQTPGRISSPLNHRVDGPSSYFPVTGHTETNRHGRPVRLTPAFPIVEHSAPENVPRNLNF